MVSEEEIQNIFVDDLEMEASLGIPEIRIPREAPEEPGMMSFDFCLLSFTGRFIKNDETFLSYPIPKQMRGLDARFSNSYSNFS